MINLETTYMGIKLSNPLIVGASPLTADLSTIKKLEDANAGAIVIKTLFEEEIQLERFKFDRDLERYDEMNAEMVSLFPKIQHSGPEEHLNWVRKAKKSVSIPVIASLNALHRTAWLEYAELLSQTGVDGLELNFYSDPKDFSKEGVEIENEQMALLKVIAKKVPLPVSVKLSPFYSNPLQFISRLDMAGAGAVVLFNRFFQPDIDISTEHDTLPLNFSNSTDYRLPLRFTGLLRGKIKADICSNTGIFNSAEVVKMILAGANSVQVVSTLYKHGITHMSRILLGLAQWMEKKGYATLDDFRGKLSKVNSYDPWLYTRSQYVNKNLHMNNLFDYRR